MPFGAELLQGEGVRFQLWAPSAKRVDLFLEREAEPIPMKIDSGGWGCVVTDHARSGSRYRYLIDGRQLVPDPASRFQPEDIQGPSEVIDPESFEWTDEWRGLPWEAMAFYELHVGTFTPEGTFRGAEKKLDYLVDLGITAIELMPVADFPGRWNWGYDGVFPFAPDSRYGRPEDLKALVQACHARGLAVFLDVVYNHFGPDGNYLWMYAPQFFSQRHRTPWGDAINFDGPRSEVVRAFFRENTLFWLEEYHFDGLRLDAVHAIFDDSSPHILEEIAAAVHAGPGASRLIHLVLENDGNEAHYLRARQPEGRRLYAAQWNDDIHHALHAIVTREREGYYIDYPDPVENLIRCLTEGFAYQGEHSAYRGRPRGEPTNGIPLAAFVSFLQNHDQIGNRAFGERLTALATDDAVRAATAVILLAPSPPMLFMGQEWSASEPFLFFSDLGPDLGPKVAEGRREEFARFSAFRDPARRVMIPDPQDEATVRRSKLRWDALDQPQHRSFREWTRGLLRQRQREIAPRLGRSEMIHARAARHGESTFIVEWGLPRKATLRLVANLGPAPSVLPSHLETRGHCVFSTAPENGRALSPWHVAYYLDFNQEHMAEWS